MKTEHPILFSDAMVRAILGGRKTQTRRVIKPQPEWRVIEPETRFARTGWWWTKPDGTGIHSQPTEAALIETFGRSLFDCPYGQPGDYLWVREAWGRSALGKVVYRADGAVRDDSDERVGWWVGDQFCERLRPSIHMPRALSRITLEVTGVRVERVQSISEEDALAEGIVWATRETAPGSGRFEPCARDEFALLWDSINAKRGYSWETNPWVWVISFERWTP